MCCKKEFECNRLAFAPYFHYDVLNPPLWGESQQQKVLLPGKWYIKVVMTPISCTGVILAGGLNTRFGGNNKALAEIGGQSILGRILKSFDTLFPETMVVTNAPLDYLAWNTLIVKDILAIRSPLAGLHTALNYARTPYIFVTACDAP